MSDHEGFWAFKFGNPAPFELLVGKSICVRLDERSAAVEEDRAFQFVPLAQASDFNFIFMLGDVDGLGEVLGQLREGWSQAHTKGEV